jgi:hypothetical protein
VKWHPTHPAVFGSVDGTGKFDLWNLNQDVEVSPAWKEQMKMMLMIGTGRLDPSVSASTQ